MDKILHVHGRENDNHKNSMFEKWFRGEVAMAFTFGGAIIGAFIYLTSPINSLRTDQALIQQALLQIKNNDLTHMELEITSINTRLDDYNKEQIVQGQQLTEVLTLLKR